nr:hypothetical protein [Paenibacillus bovis]
MKNQLSKILFLVTLAIPLLFSSISHYEIGGAIAAESEENGYKDAINQLDWDYHEIIFNKLIQFEKDNPEASEDEINAYFMELCEQYNKKNKELSINKDDPEFSPFTSTIGHPLYEIVEGLVSLNSQEQALYNANPSDGFRALVAGDEAYDVTVDRFGYNGHNDKSDAYRHAAWNIFIVAFTNGDAEWAKTWTEAHEYGAANNPSFERIMDLRNNWVGRDFAIRNNINLNSSITFTRGVADKAYFSGNLAYLPNGNTNPYVLFTGKSSDFK